jgi:hypothetical protein
MSFFEIAPLPQIVRGPDLGCSREFYPAHLSGPTRSASSLRVIVLHSTESPSARSSARYFQDPGATGSTQVLVGEDGCYRSVDDLRVPAGAPGANHDGLHVEVAGYAKWSRDQWWENAPRALEALPGILRAWSDAYGIPLHYVDHKGLLRGESGVTTHADVTRAYSGGEGHYDPGKGFPLDEVLTAARGSLLTDLAVVGTLGWLVSKLVR